MNELIFIKWALSLIAAIMFIKLCINVGTIARNSDKQIDLLKKLIDEDNSVKSE
jgi:hypothetical protein